MSSYKDLLVWQKAMDLSTAVYKATKKFPQHELYGLSSQMQRAVIAIPSNIAEGYGRGGKKEFSQFLKIARASSLELETQTILANRINYLDSDVTEGIIEDIDEISKMIYSLIRKLK